MLQQTGTASGDVTMHNPETWRDELCTTFETFGTCVRRACVESTWGAEDCALRRVGPEEFVMRSS